MTTTWDSGNKSANISLGRNSTAAATNATNGTWKSVKSTTSKSTGKWYFEATTGLIQGNGHILGLGNTTASLASYPGSDGNSVGYQVEGSTYGFTSNGWGAMSKMGEVMQCAVDIDNKLCWMRTDRAANWNNNGAANPATGVGGKSYTTTGAMFIMWGGNGGAGNTNQNGCVLNTGAFTFSGTAPSGFTAWDTGVPSATGRSGTTPTTWDSGNKNANVVLSGSNLVATQSGATGSWCGVRSTTNYDSGLVYFEITCTATSLGGWEAGLQDTATSLANGTGPGSDTTSVAFRNNTNDIYWGALSNQGSLTWNGVAATQVVGFAVDMNRGLMWVKNVTTGSNWNNDASSSPVTGIRGQWIGGILAMYIGWAGNRVGGTNDVATLNVGLSAFTGTAPSGFSAWESVTNYNASVAETMTAASTQAVAGITYNRTVAESATATSTQSLVGIVYNLAVAETATAASTQSELYGAARSVTETMTAVDSFSRVWHLFVNETLAPLDHQTRSLVYTASVVESRTITDRATQGINPHVSEVMNATMHATGATNGQWFVRVRETMALTDSFTVQNIKHGVIAETLHPLTLITATKNGTAELSITQSANAQDTVSAHLRTSGIVADVLTITSHQSAAIGPIFNLTVAESPSLTDSAIDGLTFSTTGVYFWGYEYFYHRDPAQLVSVWCAGLDCGDHAVNPNGSVFVPWSSDPDGYFNPSWLFYVSNFPPAAGFGASACNIDLTDNNGDLHRIIVDLAIGRCYTSRVQLLRPNPETMSHSQYGPSLAETRRIAKYGAHFVNTQGVSIGTTEDNLRPVSFYEPGGAKYLASRLKTGPVVGDVDDDYSFDSMLMAEIVRPYPATIAALSGFMKTMDRE